MIVIYLKYLAMLQYPDFTSPGLKEGLPATIVTLERGQILKNGHAGGAALQALQLAQPLAHRDFRDMSIKSLQARAE